MALTGNGWPAIAARSHPEHEDYSRKTLYAYMPCAGLRGTDFIDDVVQRQYNKPYGNMQKICGKNKRKYLKGFFPIS